MIKTKIAIIGIVIFYSLNLTSWAQTFSDVSKISPFYLAINYLSNKGIIDGYSDGTFKPYNPINRAELLKLLMSSADIKIIKPETHCFSDVPYTKWYSPYICSAKNAGMIDGYPDGSFKPAQNINKVEALKIIGEIYQWDLTEPTPQASFSDTKANQWYIKYLNFAQNHNLLPETGEFYKPETEIIRGNVSEILYRFLDDNIISQPAKITNPFTTDEILLEGITKAAIENEIKIVLQWQDPESDFSAHLLEPNGEEIYFMNKIDSSLKNYLETTNQSEIIHLNKLETGNYRFSVRNFSKEKNFIVGNATVAIYDNKGLVDFFYAPEIQTSTWEVFELNSDGEIRPI